MKSRYLKLTGCLLIAFVLLPVWSKGQSMNSSISGLVSDPSGAVVPNAQITLTAIATGVVAQITTGTDGLYSFPNLQVGAYELKVLAQGFREFVQRGITANINEAVRLDVKLQLGSTTQSVEVTANASPLNFDNGEVKNAITPVSLADLPLLLSGNGRSAAGFVILMPGVSTSGGGNPFDARMNGGLGSGDEAVLDGASMQEGLMSQSGMIAVYRDFPISPDVASEVTLLTSNYEPQYGSTTSGITTIVTKSGTREFHGTLHEFARNSAFNAKQYGIGKRPSDVENDFGGTIGGPIKLPWFWSGKNKTYFFASFDRMEIRGGLTTPLLSIPSLKERQGDFSDWVDAAGNLIPVYDPATTRVNPAFNAGMDVGPNNLPYLRDQFMGCDGKTPNVICATDPRLQNSLAKAWLNLLPTPNFAGPLDNTFGRTPTGNAGATVMARRDGIDWRVDWYRGDKDHVTATFHHNYQGFQKASRLPAELATEDYVGGEGWWYADRLSWDHTFTPAILNNLNYGHTDAGGPSDCLDTPYASKFPQIPGVANHLFPPQLTFDDFEPMGCNVSNYTSRPDNDFNDLLTWVKGKHTLKFGGEARLLRLDLRNTSNGSGSFDFSRLNTGLLGLESGNAVASFLLDQVNGASTSFYTVGKYYARGPTFNFHVGDTWKATPSLSIDYGVRWDLAYPTHDLFNHLAFLDPVGANPGADDRPGRLAFAGTQYGAASYGRAYPEHNWYRAVAPRVGFAYRVRPKTVARAGYGIFFAQNYYPGWGAGMALDGFNATPSFSSSEGGLTAAFLLSNGFPQNFTRPPFIDSSFLNGQNGPEYRPLDSGRLSYAQQWNLTLEHQFTENSYISAAYVANKGTHLPSDLDPRNVLDPKLLSMGPALFDQFQPGQTELDGVQIPYNGWVQQMTACAPTVAQALVAYPQYCGSLRGINEKLGSSTYHSFQLKVENRFSHGLWLVGSYTASKLLTESDTVNQPAGVGAGGTAAYGVISPYQRNRERALSYDDTPQVLSLSMIYKFPVGKGQHYLNRGGVADKILGGWRMVNVFRAASGTPFYFRSSACTVPSQFDAGCIPGILPGANPWAQDKGHLNLNKPLFNVAAFEPADSFNFYLGQGPRISGNLREFGYHDHDFSLIKNFAITEKASVEVTAQFFNVWNWHILTCQTECWGTPGFSIDIASPSFGMWNGNVSPPRNIQLGAKIIF